MTRRMAPWLGARHCGAGVETVVEATHMLSPGLSVAIGDFRGVVTVTGITRGDSRRHSRHASQRS